MLGAVLRELPSGKSLGCTIGRPGRLEHCGARDDIQPLRRAGEKRVEIVLRVEVGIRWIPCTLKPLVRLMQMQLILDSLSCTEYSVVNGD